jgi:hypothetical protein
MCTVLLPPGGYPIAVNKYITYQVWVKNHKQWRWQNMEAVSSKTEALGLGVSKNAGTKLLIEIYNCRYCSLTTWKKKRFQENGRLKSLAEF